MNGGTWKGEGCRLPPLSGVTVCVKVLVFETSGRFSTINTASLWGNEGTLVSSLRPTLTHTDIPHPTAVHNTTKVDIADHLYTNKALAIVLIRRVLLDGELTIEKVRLDSAIFP